MGTLQEWMRVLELGAIFGVSMLLLDALSQREKVAAWQNLFSTALASFIFGMTWVFGWQLLHGGIGLLFFGTVLIAFGLAFAVRRARKSAETAR